MKPRRRVLVIAEAANPEWVSVPLVGWSVASALREVADVHIVTQVRNRDAIERSGLSEGRDFTAIDTEAVMRHVWSVSSFLRGGSNKGWTLVTTLQSLFYPVFERAVWNRFGKRIEAREFDVVHRVTPLSMTAPSSLARKCAGAGVPFVVGPLNGGVPWPKGFNRERHQEREWLSYIRSLYRLNPGTRSTWRNASAIIVASLHSRSELPTSASNRTIFIPENAINPARFTKPDKPERAPFAQLKLCFIGRLVPYKGPDIALEAARDLLLDGRAQLTIIGDGPMMKSLQVQAERMGVSQSVTFTGWVDHSQVPTVAGQSDVLLFPSVREFGGGAVIEAMALGLVPIVVNYGGPGEIVTSSTGFRLTLNSRESLIADAATVLRELADGQHDLSTMAMKGLERIHTLYTWNKKALQLNEVYDWVCGDRRDPPKFPFFEE